MKSEEVSRRTFLKQSGASALAAKTVVGVGSAAVLRAQGASQKLRIGFVGPGGRGMSHVRALCELQKGGANIELAAVCDVYSEHRQRAADYIKETVGNAPTQYEDYREMFARENLDAVTVATPDHWHSTQTLEALHQGMDVYCEKPMTKTVQEAIDVMDAWNRTGRVMQVGVQSTSLPVWNRARDLMQSGQLGKVLMYQTEFFRNSAIGQWRYYKLTQEMNPANINWDMWLGREEGLAPEMPFDRAVYIQWRRFWPFGAGMYTDLFVHRTTSMLKATGLRFPARVVGSGGIYLEYDGRGVPDVATVVAEFNEGVQGLVTATMCSQNTPIRQLIRGHYGAFVFGNGEEFTGFDFIPEPESITGQSEETQRIEVEPEVKNTTLAHFKNWLDAIWAGDPKACNNPPDLGAAAITLVNLGARSYREGKVFHFDPEAMQISDGDSSWSKKWERMSHTRAEPKHIPGWKAGEEGSLLTNPPYQKLEGPWYGGKPPEEQH